MKFEIKKEVLSKGLNRVVSVASTKSLLPILNGLYLSVSEEGITIIGSNGDISIKSFIPTVIDEEPIIKGIEAGSIVVQAKLLNDIVKKLPNKVVTVDVNADYHVLVKSGKSKFKLNGQDAEEYPKLPEVSNKALFQVSSKLLRNVIKETIFATANSETRPILTGVNVRATGEQLQFVATDSHRLSQCMVDVIDLQELENVTIPGKSLLEVNKVLPESEDMVKVSFNGSTVLFEAEEVVIYSRILDGNYPETSRLIPDTSKTTINISKKELLDTIERASLLSKDGNNVVKLTINGGLMAEITSNSPEIGNVTEEVVISNFEGEEIILSFSAKFAIDALKALSDDDVIINFNGPMRPFTITPIEDKSVLQLVLPVRTY